MEDKNIMAIRQIRTIGDEILTMNTRPVKENKNSY